MQIWNKKETENRVRDMENKKIRNVCIKTQKICLNYLLRSYRRNIPSSHYKCRIIRCNFAVERPRSAV